VYDTERPAPKWLGEGANLFRGRYEDVCSMSAARQSPISPAQKASLPEGIDVLLGGLIALYAAARVTQAFPETIPMLAIVAAHVLVPLLFALIHGALAYGFRGILVFTLLCCAWGNLFENLSVVTGFPFGHYHFTDVMGPKLFHVPILLGLAYVGMGYLSWALGRLIAGNPDEPRRRWALIISPLIAACAMVAWDLSMDPIWSNLVHGWVWRDGGAYFGVPVSNFFGWFLANYAIFQSFALFLRGRTATLRSRPANIWQPTVVMYAVSAAGNLFVMAPPGVTVIRDAAGIQWSVRGMLTVSELVSIVVMGALVAVACARMAKGRNIG
jgi:uncharacterized membrane protein